MYTWKKKKAELGVHEYNALLSCRRDEMLAAEETGQLLLLEESAVGGHSNSEMDVIRLIRGRNLLIASVKALFI